ncbi:MAG: UbiH/UbiF family hydroxylase [Methyloligellaceae bacterium]
MSHTNHEKTQTASADIAVIGAGPAGLTAALALAVSGSRVICAGPIFDPATGAADTRTTALLGCSVQLLENLGVWRDCIDSAAPLDAIRIIDDTARLVRAPDIEFRAEELGEGPFGYNVPNSILVTKLLQRVRALPNLTLIQTGGATAVRPAAESIGIELEEGLKIAARLVVGADGRRSLCRQAAGIATESWQYDQTAIACNFDHSETHANISNEFHGRAGPFTTVPLPGRASSLVWVERPGEAKRLMTLAEPRIAEEIEKRTHGLLGSVTAVGPRAAFPLSGLTADTLARQRIALVGEAGHVIPPIGAQGLNLGFRDAAALADLVIAALADGRDPGAAEVLVAYDRSRRSDVATRTVAVDLLNRSLVSGFLPIQAARGLGLHLLNSVGPLRRLVMRQGLAPTTNLPQLMR